MYKKLVEDSENKEDSSVRMRLQSMKHKIMGNKSVTASTGFRSTSAAIQKEPLRFNLERDVGPINLSKLHPS